MTQEEFDRIKEEEKAHLRRMRELKRTYRQTQQKKSLVDSLTDMTNALDEAESRDEVDELMRGAALQEARLELALESRNEETNSDVMSEEDRDAMQRAEAASLLHQMKQELGGDLASDAKNKNEEGSGSEEPAQAEKTLGRPRDE